MTPPDDLIEVLEASAKRNEPNTPVTQRLSDIHQEMEVGQKPVAAQHRFRHPQKGTPDWSVWQPCKVSQRPEWEVDSQGYEVEYRALYTHPAPEAKQERKPLTDEEIIAIRDRYHRLMGPFEFARAIEAAHGIKE